MATEYLAAATAEKMSPIHWAIRPLKRYADFKGRAPRAEYWWFALATFIAGIGLYLLDKLLGGPIVGSDGPLSLIFTLVLVVPNLSVAVRRLHDIDRSGWWVLLDLWQYAFSALSFARLSVDSEFKILGPAITLGVLLGAVACGVTMLVFCVTRGTEGPNRFGPDPYGPDALEEVFA